MAGLYATWRLLRQGVRPDRLALYEATERTGGRALTVAPPQREPFAVDMGAHNFSEAHVIVAGLASAFGLAAVESAGQSRAGIVHLRGRSRSNAEIKRSWLRRPFDYAVPAYLQRRGPGRILRKALEAMPFGDETRTARRLNGRPLADWPLPDALRQVLSPEEIRYVADRLTYSFWDRPVQAEATLGWVAREVFRGKGRIYEFPGGMAVLSQALAAAIGASGGSIASAHRLVDIRLPDSGGTPITLGFETAAGRRTLRAGRLILALPPAAIAAIAPLAGRPEIAALRAAVMPQEAVTTALYYADAWWRRFGIVGADSTTDLPLRHVRHHGMETWRRDAARTGVLVSYSDGGNADFWRRLSDGKEPPGWLGPDFPLVAELHRQVERIFGPRLEGTVPAPESGLVRFWSEAGAGAAFHLWAAGSRPESMAQVALQPIAGLNLHVCGEAWSLRQGWIEGALETVDCLIERHLDPTGPWPR